MMDLHINQLRLRWLDITPVTPFFIALNIVAYYLEAF